MKKIHLAYWIVNEFSLFEDHPELIFSNRTVINPEFDQKKLMFERNSLFHVWPHDVRVYVAGNEPVDLLLCTAYMEIVSERAKRIIEELARAEVEFLPISVYQDDGNPYAPMNYWVLHVMTFLDALDWENTMWTKPPPPDKNRLPASIGIIKPCLKTQVIENHHIYGLEVAGKIRSGKYVSPTLKDALTKSGCSIGIVFSPVKTT
jgi:hypothetical protein